MVSYDSKFEAFFQTLMKKEVLNLYYKEKLKKILKEYF